MKTLKTFFLTTMGISLLLLTGCTVSQGLPYDDVYSSGTKPLPQQTVTQHYSAPQPQNNNTYQEGNVQVVNLANNDTVQEADTSQYAKEVVLIKNDTAQPATNIYNYYSSGLNFNSPYFGTGSYSWSLGGYNSYWRTGFYGYWNYPGSWYPSYYSWLYPYRSWYGWYGAYDIYNWGYPYYNNYYGYYPSSFTNVFGNNRYGHRNTHSLGGNLPRNSSGVVMPVKSSRTNSRTNTKSTSVSSKTTRPALSGRSPEIYKRIQDKKGVLGNEKRALYRKPVNRSGESGRYQRNDRFKSPALRYRIQQKNSVSTSRPRYQKPKQYQSLDNRNPRSSKEYFRQQTTRIVRTVPVNKTTRVNINTPARRYNVYRPANMRRVNQRPVYQTPANNRTRYQPTRVVSPYKSTRTYTPNRSFTPTRSYSPSKTKNTYRPSPPRVSPPRTTTTTNTSGGGGSRPHRR